MSLSFCNQIQFPHLELLRAKYHLVQKLVKENERDFASSFVGGAPSGRHQLSQGGLRERLNVSIKKSTTITTTSSACALECASSNVKREAVLALMPSK